jgi:hypothetical protein
VASFPLGGEEHLKLLSDYLDCDHPIEVPDAVSPIRHVSNSNNTKAQQENKTSSHFSAATSRDDIDTDDRQYHQHGKCSGNSAANDTRGNTEEESTEGAVVTSSVTADCIDSTTAASVIGVVSQDLEVNRKRKLLIGSDDGNSMGEPPNGNNEECSVNNMVKMAKMGGSNNKIDSSLSSLFSCYGSDSSDDNDNDNGSDSNSGNFNSCSSIGNPDGCTDNAKSTGSTRIDIGTTTSKSNNSSDTMTLAVASSADIIENSDENRDRDRPVDDADLGNAVRVNGISADAVIKSDNADDNDSGSDSGSNSNSAVIAIECIECRVGNRLFRLSLLNTTTKTDSISQSINQINSNNNRFVEVM